MYFISLFSWDSHRKDFDEVPILGANFGEEDQRRAQIVLNKLLMDFAEVESLYYETRKTPGQFFL